MELSIQNILYEIKEGNDLSVNIDLSTILNDEFIEFEVIDTFSEPKTVECYGNSDSDIVYKKVYRDLTLYKASKYELFICGYFEDAGNGFHGWSTKYDIEEINKNKTYHKTLLKKYGVDYAQDLNLYASKKLKNLKENNKKKSKEYSYWLKVYKATQNMVNQNQPQISM